MKWFGGKKKTNVTVDWDNSMEIHSHGPAPVVISFDKEAEQEYETAWAATAEEMKRVKGGYRNDALEAYKRELAEADGCVGCCAGEAMMESFKPPSCADNSNKSLGDGNVTPVLLEDPNYSNRARSNSSTASAVSIHDARSMTSIRDGKVTKKNRQDSQSKGWLYMDDDEKASRFYKKVALMSCLCVLIAAFIILLVALINKNNPTDESELNLGDAAASSENGSGGNNESILPEEDTECEGKAPFLIFTSCGAINEPESPQWNAWNWIMNSDDAGLSLEMGASEFDLQQRFAAATLYFATGGNDWLSGLGFLSGGSVCTWNDGEKGIFCRDSENSAVTEINIGK
jgi:hypothetical protein